MRWLDVLFWLFAAGVIGFILWTWLRAMGEMFESPRNRRPAKHRGGTGGISSGDSSFTLFDAGSGSDSNSDTSAGDTSGGDFSGGGGESGGGG
ncbi:MAG: hypothetical protein ACLGH0_05450, partial [Thermoanaerobaculia bacterium]